MRILFEISGKQIHIADKERCIFCIDSVFYDKNGARTDFAKVSSSNDPHDEGSTKRQALERPLFPRSTTEPEFEIDDIFGNFGFVDENGKYVIEPQYAYANEFTMGLAAVNLNRTWYTSENGRRYYENHCGYIDGNGRTVIGFKFDEAYPFNKYGVALVSEPETGWYLIDESGNEIQGTRFGCISKFDYNDRYAEIGGEDSEDAMGVYDTKERKILVDISEDIDGMIEWDEDQILIFAKDKSGHPGCFYQHYIDSSGNILYPWLYKKGFNIVRRPNDNNVSAVAKFEFEDYKGEAGSYYEHEGKKLRRKELYGLYSSKEVFVLPMIYEEIRQMGDNIYGCLKDGVIMVVETENGD